MSDQAPETEEPMPPAPLAVVFDVGEVVIDETRVWATWAELLGVSPLTFAAVLGAAVVQGESFEAVFEHLAPNVDWEPLEPAHEQAYGGFRPEDVYPDVRPCFEELRELGITVALAGNQPARRTEQLRALDLPVDAIATSDDLGAEKPSSAFFEAMLSLLGDVAPDRILYVGDRVDNDVLPANEFGLRTCWLRRGPWGVLQDLPVDGDADLVLDGLGELGTLLADWQAAAAE